MPKYEPRRKWGFNEKGGYHVQMTDGRQYYKWEGAEGKEFYKDLDTGEVFRKKKMPYGEVRLI